MYKYSAFCVAFLMQDVEGPNGLHRKALGTSFVVRLPGKQNNHFLVTARHNCELADKTRPLFARLNVRTDEGLRIQDTEIQHQDWTHHWKTDVAIAPFSTPEKVWLAPIDSSRLLRTISAHGLGSPSVGDEVMIASLFSLVPGVQSMIPASRFGRISQIPDEEVEIKLGPNLKGQTRIVVIESISWGGCSGAPVFVEERQTGKHPAVPPRLLGLINGHYEFEKDIKNTPHDSKLKVSLNSGLAIVIPALYILELLESI